jgi:hypothetical protein
MCLKLKSLFSLKDKFLANKKKKILAGSCISATREEKNVTISTSIEWEHLKNSRKSSLLRKDQIYFLFLW